MKLLARFHLVLYHIRKNTSIHCFQDTLNAICNFRSDIEALNHFFDCLYFTVR